ncbi:MAG: hypothetical protein Q4G33_14790 [bacterium]|nr:hypothetical protein [bacterium]
MEKSMCKKHILMAFMREGMLISNVLRTITDQEPYMRKLLTQMTSEGLLAKGCVTGKRHSRKWTLTYRRITPKGVQWLIDNCADEYPWLKYIPVPVPRFSVTQDLSGMRFARFLRSVSASVLFSNFGIETAQYKNLERTLTDEHKMITFRTLKANAIAAYEQTLKLPESASVDALVDAPVRRYYHSRDLKDVFALSESEAKQYMFSTHIGLLINRSYSYFIYYADVGGPLFERNVIERARTSARRYIRANNLTDEGFGVCERGIVLCKNSKDFESMFRLNYNRIQNRTGINEVNKGICYVFRNIYAVPLNSLSVYALDDILHYADEVENITIEQLLRIDTGFERTNTRIIPLTYNGIKTYVGTSMELGCMQRFFIEAVSEHNRNEKYMIVCYQYQEEYYKRIFPDNVCYYHVTDDMLHPAELE